MNHSKLRELLIENKSFLKNLYKLSSLAQKKQFLLSSSEIEIDVLLQVLYAITQGEIPINKSNFKILKKSYKILLHTKFLNEIILTKVSASTLKQKTLLLSKFLPIYSILLFPLFNR